LDVIGGAGVRGGISVEATARGPTGMTMPDMGYVYVFSGPSRFLDEAANSLRSLRRVDGEAHATAVVTQSLADGARAHFDNVVVVPDPPPGEKKAWLFRAKHVYTASPYARTLHVDTDTYFLSSLRGVFASLDHHDVALTLSTRDRTPVLHNGRVAEGVIPFNCGVIFFKRSDASAALFSAWASHLRTDFGRLVSDQPALAEVILTSGCRVLPLPTNYNVRLPAIEKLRGPALLIHGRHPDMELVGRRLNATIEERVWIPWLEACIHPRSGPRVLLKATAIAAARRVGRLFAGR
jgi:hypothetical protein